MHSNAWPVLKERVEKVDECQVGPDLSTYTIRGDVRTTAFNESHCGIILVEISRSSEG
jgi:hypothetical protein